MEEAREAFNGFLKLSAIFFIFSIFYIYIISKIFKKNTKRRK